MVMQGIMTELEFEKCKESPLYMYNTYYLKEGQPKVTQREFDLMVYSAKSIYMQKRRAVLPLKPFNLNILPEFLKTQSK